MFTNEKLLLQTPRYTVILMLLCFVFHIVVLFGYINGTEIYDLDRARSLELLSLTDKSFHSRVMQLDWSDSGPSWPKCRLMVRFRSEQVTLAEDTSDQFIQLNRTLIECLLFLRRLRRSWVKGLFLVQYTVSAIDDVVSFDYVHARRHNQIYDIGN